MSKKGSSDNSQSRSQDVQNVTQRKKPDGDASSGSEIKELTSEVRLLVKEFASLKTSLEEATHSLSLCNERQEVIGKRVDNNEKRIEHLEAHSQDVKLLNHSFSQLQRELNFQAQACMRNDIELAGVPERSDENLLELVIIVAQKLGIELNEQDIEWMSRMGPQSQPSDDKKRLPRQIVVRFLRRSKRDEILKAAKSKRSLTSVDVGVPGEPLKLYLNERLTKENRLLFRDARERCRQQNFSFCWCNMGTIYVRKQQGKPGQAVRSHDDLERIIGSSTNTT